MSTRYKVWVEIERQTDGEECENLAHTGEVEPIDLAVFNTLDEATRYVDQLEIDARTDADLRAFDEEATP